MTEVLATDDVNIDVGETKESTEPTEAVEVEPVKSAEPNGVLENVEVTVEKTEAPEGDDDDDSKKDTAKLVQNGNVKHDGGQGISCTLAHATDYVTTDRSTPVKLRLKEGLGKDPISVMEFFERQVKRYANRTALKVERDGNWISWTYKEYLEDVKTVAKAFIKLGLEPYHGVGILGFNSPEWLFSDVGSIYAGGLCVGIYTTNNPEACQYVCADAECNIIVVENDVQLQKILQVKDRIPSLKAIVQYTGELKEKLPDVYTWNELIEIGKGETDEELQTRMNGQSPNKCCTLIYTSGTTGNPKGVMVSHDNMIAALDQVLASFYPIIDPDNESFQEQAISYLPLSHIAAQMTDIWIPTGVGGCVWFARPDALKGSLTQTLLAARPTLFVGVPRVFEKIEEKMKGIGANIKGLKRKLGDWAKGVALRGNQNMESGKEVPYGWTIATGLILKKIRKALGLDRAKMIFTAAAPISKQTLQYFQSLNIPLLELYGLSESTGAITVNTPSKCRITSIGPVLDIDEYRIANPDEDGSGELCFRGRNIFMGYLNNAEKTKEAIDDDGWLHTGDVGKVDEDGFFYITGRIKELIVTAGGENIAPIPIEDNIKLEIPLVATCMVIGDKKKFLSCLLTCQVEIDLDSGLPTDNLLPSAVHYCSELGLNVTKASEIAPDTPEVLKNAIQEGINNANKKACSNAARVQKWHLFPLDFTTAGGELGPTQKLRRPHVMKTTSYKEVIDKFYDC